MLLTVGGSLASPPNAGSTAFVAQTATQMVAKSSSAASSVVNFAIKDTSCLPYAGTCCAACSAGMIAAGWAAAQDFVLHFDITPPLIGLSSAELDTQFRPPRLFL